jgi:hypothetical protein
MSHHPNPNHLPEFIKIELFFISSIINHFLINHQMLQQITTKTMATFSASQLDSFFYEWPSNDIKSCSQSLSCL